MASDTPAAACPKCGSQLYDGQHHDANDRKTCPLPDDARIAAEEAFAKVYNDPVTLAACLRAALEAAAPAIRAQAAAAERERLVSKLRESGHRDAAWLSDWLNGDDLSWLEGDADGN